MAKSFRETIGMQPSTASTKDSVLIIIDAQNEYADGNLKTANVDSTRKSISNLLTRYREASGSIIHVVHQVPDGAPVFTPNTQLAQPFAELAPQKDEKTVTKNLPGAFGNTALEEHVKATGKDKVVLCGYMAHVCVSTTAREAAARGLDVVLADGAVGDRDVPGASAQDLVNMTFVEIADAFGSVVKAEDIK